MPDKEREAQILKLIRSVPEGFVTTYGDLCPEAPRLPGRILSVTKEKDLPWHRIVRADGSFAQGERRRFGRCARGGRGLGRCWRRRRRRRGRTL